MTTLGKILAILNLVLSLFVGWLIVMTYVGRTNWHAAYDGVSAQLKVAQADANTYKAEIEEHRQATRKAEQALAALEKKSQGDALAADAQNKALLVKLDESTKELKNAQAAHVSVQEENRRLHGETDYLKGVVADKDKLIATKEQEREEARNMATEQLIAANAEHERNRQLLSENERLSKVVQEYERNGGTLTRTAAGQRKNPPPQDVEGIVKAVDPQSGYITLSIGSDSGLNKGNTLEAFRLRPEASYLGTVEILAVEPNQAVAKPLTQPKGALQVGDRVATNIVNAR
jgi:chromosome segregation ATPase